MRAFVGIVLLAAILAGCGSEQDEGQPAVVEDPGAVHVHGLGRNPSDGSLMIATHTGLLRAADDADDGPRHHLWLETRRGRPSAAPSSVSSGFRGADQGAWKTS